MSAEPISTRIARLKGCSPVSDGDGGWMCHCALNKHGDWCAQCGDRHEYIDEAWLAAAASFALLAEMADAGLMPMLLSGWPEGDGGPFACQWVEGPEAELPDVSAAPTYGEAIGLAWLAWKESRQ